MWKTNVYQEVPAGVCVASGKPIFDQLQCLRFQFKLTNSLNFQSWEPVAHTCNPSYSGGRDQVDRS
jgi:hypothetical protein